MSMEKIPAVLALADGKIFRGWSFGAHRDERNPVVGEVVFNTSMYGYQEILSDPSYAGQIMTFTYPHIGNVGCNEEDEESGQLFVEGLIIRELSKVTSNFRSKKTLSAHLEAHNKMGISGIDTRELVSYLRDNGSQMGAIAAGGSVSVDALIDRAKAAGSMEGKDYVKHVSCVEPYAWSELPWKLGTDIKTGSMVRGHQRIVSQEKAASRPHVVALDCGIKYNILRQLVSAGFRVTVAPATATAQEIAALKPDGFFLSNGPGDPATLGYIVSTVKDLVGKVPIFGICLGHQILAQVFGGTTYKLKYGHRGGNHPVMDFKTGKVEITVQNHGFAVDGASLPKEVTVSHLNLNDKTIEGLDIPDAKAFSIQYHPESSPGPHDAQYLFNRFHELVVGA